MASHPCATQHQEYLIPVGPDRTRCLKCWHLFMPLTLNPGFIKPKKKKGAEKTEALLDAYRYSMAEAEEASDVIRTRIRAAGTTPTH